MKATVYLITATALMMLVIALYNPVKPAEVVEEPTAEEPLIESEERYLELYSHEIFKDSTFGFVRADTNLGYAIYEVVGEGDAKELKAKLQDHLKAQGYEEMVVLFLLDPNDYEVVKTVL